MTTTQSRLPKTRPSDHNSTPRAGSIPRKPLLVIAGVIIVAFAALFVVFSFSNPPGGGGDGFPYAVGNPGPGEEAPPMRLPSTDGDTFDLADARGQRLMLYFQEGVMCQPCWDQLQDIEARWDEFAAFGIDGAVSITSDPLDVLEGKVALEGLTTPVLSDPGVEVSATYEANDYGMMGTSMNGHSFVIVGPDGTIEWRADYGGAPDYTMYVPVDALLADLGAGLQLSPRAAN